LLRFKIPPKGLEKTSKRGVDVKIVMTNSSDWLSDFQKLTDAGVHVHLSASNAKIYIHAKMIIADGKESFIGSENFSYNSLQANRELGIIFRNKKIIKSLEEIFTGDFQNASAFAK